MKRKNVHAALDDLRHALVAHVAEEVGRLREQVTDIFNGQSSTVLEARVSNMDGRIGKLCDDANMRTLDMAKAIKNVEKAVESAQKIVKDKLDQFAGRLSTFDAELKRLDAELKRLDSAKGLDAAIQRAKSEILGSVTLEVTSETRDLAANVPTLSQFNDLLDKHEALAGLVLKIYGKKKRGKKK